MSTTSLVSFLTASTTQTYNLNSLRTTMDTLQRQVTTQKKYDNYSGYGTDTIALQRLRNDQNITGQYLSNINTVTNRMQNMTDVMNKITGLARTVLTSLQNATSESMPAISASAQQNLQFIEDLLNQNIGGQYLFAGANSSSPPFINDPTMNANFRNQITSWLAGGQTDVQFINTTDAFTLANLGLSPGLTTAGNVTARVSPNVDVDYTVKADLSGFQDILRALGTVSNLTYPNPLTDIASPAQFENIIGHAKDLLSQGTQSVNDATQQMANKFSLLKSFQDTYNSNQSVTATQIADIENVDAPSAIIQMQSLQTQLTASYQITKIVSDMSLTHFM